MGRAAAHLERGKDANGDQIRRAPLAVPLARLFAGDHRAAHEIVETLAGMAFDQSWKMKIKVSRPGAHDMACACLAWHRNGRCNPCGGHGYDLIPGVPSLSAHECHHCQGTGKVPFEEQFPVEIIPLARWMLVEMERESGRAWQAAMKALAPTLEL